MAVLQTSCILGPEMEGAPQEVLYAPEILLGSLVPGDNGTILDIDQNCCSTDFVFGTVRDFNVKDKLYVRWFVDWDRNKPKEPGGGSTWPNPLTIATTKAPERKGLTYTLQNADFEPLGDTVHTLKVFVADRTLWEYGDGTEAIDEPDMQSDTVYWFFQVSAVTGYCSSNKYLPCTD
jgi:hypothetical protein